MPIPVYDIAIIGGGINGCGIARDAAGRGLTVHLCEQGDLASAASSASTKLLHGTTRHLEHSGFRSVREALDERDILHAIAPHIVRPVRIVQPLGAGSRPRFLARAGAFFYDRVGGGKYLPPTRPIDFSTEPYGPFFKGEIRSGLEYSDCMVDDSRLVVLNAMDAKSQGAHIQTNTRCIAARRASGYWRLLLESSETGERQQIAARALVNASGAWVGHVLEKIIKSDARASVRLVKRTNIVTRRLYQHDTAHMLRNYDGRIVFTIPFEREFTLIGATESDYQGDPGQAIPGDWEIDYLCGAASQYFNEPVTPETIRFVYCGVHPIYNDGASKSREARRNFVLDLDGSDGPTPLLSILTGKITTYRQLAEQALTQLAPYLRMGEPWTAPAPLPGGGFAVDTADDIIRALRAAYPFLSEVNAVRLVNAYGTRAASILTGARRPEDLGRDFGFGLTEAEVVFLMAEEWAQTASDVLWRRSRLGLYFNAAQTKTLDAFMAEARPRVASSAA